MSKLNDELSEDTYGESFGLSDILACYIDFGNNDDNMIRISFTKNGQDYGQAFEFDKTNYSNNNDENRFIFYPHILVKNVKFECNFGQLVREKSSIDLYKKVIQFFRKLHGQKSKIIIYLHKIFLLMNEYVHQNQLVKKVIVKLCYFLV